MAKTVAVGEAELSAILADVENNNAEVVITTDGQAVARVIPAFRDVTMRTLEELRGSVTIHGDIVEPIGDWDAVK